MLRSIIILAAAAFSTAGFAQEQAAVDPTVPLPSVTDVVGQCEIVAADAGGAASASGLCLTATESFLAALEGRDPAVIDQSLTDLVVAIAPLVQDDVCNEADEEVAQAIRLASTMASTPEQIAQLADIADTVAACEGTTAAVEAPEGDPASAA